jgi:hypothetical protein
MGVTPLLVTPAAGGEPRCINPGFTHPWALAPRKEGGQLEGSLPPNAPQTTDEPPGPPAGWGKMAGAGSEESRPAGLRKRYMRAHSGCADFYYALVRSIPPEDAQRWAQIYGVILSYPPPIPYSVE